MPLRKLDKVERTERIERQEVERKPESRNINLFWTPAFAGVTEKETAFYKITRIDKTLLMHGR